VLVFTVNGVPTRTYLHRRDPEPPRLLVAELDGWRVVWTPDPRRASCTRHPHQPGRCRCIAALGRLADLAALRGWYRGLGWRQRQQLQTAPAAIAATVGQAERDRPDWTWGLGGRLVLAAAVVALLLLLAPLLHR
jgi:hypothetical protein